MSARPDRDAAAAAALADTLLWLCSVPSPIGEEQELCAAVAERLGRAQLAAPVRRHGDSLVAQVTQGDRKSVV